MKLLIQDDLQYTETYYPGITDEDYELNSESLLETGKILKSLGVSYNIENKESYFTITIYTQKVNLDESNMNWLFFDVLYDFPFKFKLKYAHLGGKGCEFSLEITTK